MHKSMNQKSTQCKGLQRVRTEWKSDSHNLRKRAEETKALSGVMD